MSHSPGVTQSPAGTQPAATPSTATTPAPTPPAATTQPPAATTAAPTGSNTITYEITGDYEATGEAVFNEDSSIYWEEGQYGSREGWVAYFEAGDISLRLSTRTDEESVEFRDGEYVVTANAYDGSDHECIFTLTRNAPSGPVGSAVCERAVVHPNGATYVDVSLEWEVNL